MALDFQWRRSFLYASKTLIGAALCWYGLQAVGIENPLWAVITVIIVSDPDLATAWQLAVARVINTLVGCGVGLAIMLLWGYSAVAMLLGAAFTVLVVTSLRSYPATWRLAPATVVILMDAGREAAGRRMKSITCCCALARFWWAAWWPCCCPTFIPVFLRNQR